MIKHGFYFIYIIYLITTPNSQIIIFCLITVTTIPILQHNR